jgi:uncharacterized protein (TIRG00374 family)
MAMPGTIAPRRIAAFVIALVILIAVGIAAVDARSALGILRSASWGWLGAALLAVLVSYLCLSAALALLMRLFGVGVPIRYLLTIGFVSFAVNNVFSLGGLTGYSTRLFLLGRRGAAMESVLGASLVHSYLNQIVMITLFPSCLFYLFLKHPLGHARTLQLTVAATIALAVMAVATLLLFHDPIRSRAARLVGRTSRTVLRRDVDPHLDSLHQSLARGMAVIRGRPRRLVLAALLMVVDWLSSAVALGFCFRALGSVLPPGVLVTGFALGVIAGGASMIPGGLGVQEGSMTGVFILLGVRSETAFLAALSFRLVYYLIPFGLSLVLYARESSSGDTARNASRAAS